MTRAIDKWQIKAIYALGSGLQIVGRSGCEDELHGLVEGITGKRSVKDLTRDEANRVIDELKTRMKGVPTVQHRQRKTKEYKDTRGGMTAGQQRKVWYLMVQLAGCDLQKSTASLGERLAGIIRKEFGFSVGNREPLQWFTADQGWQLIEILKRYVASAEKKVMRG